MYFKTMNICTMNGLWDGCEFYCFLESSVVLRNLLNAEATFMINGVLGLTLALNLAGSLFLLFAGAHFE